MNENQLLLNGLLFLPALGAILVLLLPAQLRSWGRPLALVFSLGAAVCALVIAQVFDPLVVPSALSIKATWLPQLGASFALAVDGLNLPLLLLTAWLTPLVLIGTWSVRSAQNESGQFKVIPALVLLMETGALGTFLSQDLLLFYVFWELILVPAYLLVGMYGGAQRAKATLQFFLYTFAGSLLMLLGIVWLIFQQQQATGVADASIASITSLSLPFGGPLGGLLSVQGLLFLVFGAAFFIKAPLVPLHGWMAATYTQAPIAVTIYLAAILSKMGTYGILKLMLPLFPQAMHAYGPVLMWMAAAGVIYGALLALAQKNIKAAIAYSSLSHVSYILLGLFSLQGAGISGSLLQMVNHGIVIAGLFFLAHCLEERRGSQLLTDFGGWARATPLLASFLMLFVLSSVALPGTNGFVGEFMVLIASFRVNALATAVAAAGMVFGALYMLNVYQRVMFGASKVGAAIEQKDLGFAEVLVVTVLGGFVVGIGIAPQPFLSRSVAAVETLKQRIAAPVATSDVQPQVSSTQDPIAQ